jgi:hypothetical protein
MLHLGLVATLAAMVGPYSYYFLTSEPVLFAALAFMTGRAIMGRRMRQCGDCQFKVFRGFVSERTRPRHGVP